MINTIDSKWDMDNDGNYCKKESVLDVAHDCMLMKF